MCVCVCVCVCVLTLKSITKDSQKAYKKGKYGPKRATQNKPMGNMYMYSAIPTIMFLVLLLMGDCSCYFTLMSFR